MAKRFLQQLTLLAIYCTCAKLVEAIGVMSFSVAMFWMYIFLVVILHVYVYGKDVFKSMDKNARELDEEVIETKSEESRKFLYGISFFAISGSILFIFSPIVFALPICWIFNMDLYIVTDIILTLVYEFVAIGYTIFGEEDPFLLRENNNLSEAERCEEFEEFCNERNNK